MDAEQGESLRRDPVGSGSLRKTAITLATELRGHPLLVLYVVGAVIRLLYVIRTGPVVGGDSPSYIADAGAIWRADIGSLTRPPLYPLFLALTGNVQAAVLVQCLVTAASAPLVAAATRRHFGGRAGWVAGSVAAAEPAFVFWTSYVLSDAFALTIFAAFVERASAAIARSSGVGALWFGVSAGALSIVRAAYVPLALTGLAAPILSRTRGGASVLGFCAGLILIIGVSWLPTAMLGRGAPQYVSSYWETLFNGSEWTEVGRGTIGIDIAVIPEVEGMSPSARAAYYQQRFLAFVGEHPGDYVVLAFRKALWYWLPAYPEWSPSHRLGASAYYTALYAFALLGAVLSIRSRFSWLLIACLAVATLTAMATIVDYDARYRLPAELLLIPLAATGVVWVWGAIVRSLVHRGQDVAAGA